MKTRTTKNLLLRSSMALAVMVTIQFPASAWSADPAQGKGIMLEQCEEMKKEKQKMQEEMKAQDAELTAAVASMNRAQQDKKLDLLAGVVTQLVEQRTAMHAQKAKMQEKMMAHMMQHMQMGKESMSKCPMMKGMRGMKGIDDSSADAHEEHQQE